MLWEGWGMLFWGEGVGEWLSATCMEEWGLEQQSPDELQYDDEP